VQQDDALLGAVAHRRALEHVDQAHQRDVEAEDRVLAVVDGVVEEVVVDDLLLVVDPYSSVPQEMIMSYRRWNALRVTTFGFLRTISR
jgi:hypothetical protein